MFTDLVGFTRLGQRDEEAALRLRREHQTLVRAPVVAHGGREVKTLGDGFLIEFPSAVESVRSAVEIQEAASRRNSAPGVTEPLRLRIGIHVGDVVEDGSDIVGDAVNIASRIEPLAEPGGICLSSTVFDQVRNKLRLPLEGLGPRRLKNIEEPVEVYRVVLSGEAKPSAAATSEDAARLRFAVLPFANRSPDAKDEYLADGLTDELISHVAKLPNVRVIARTSVLRFKDATHTAREIGAELGVRLILEGSVRKAGDRLRISAQMVDAGTEETVWSSRFDRPLDDIFAIQDEIAGEIATQIATQLSRSGVTTLVPFVRAPPDTADLDAYAEFLRGRQLASERRSEATMRNALALFESAVARDPVFARARVGLADCVIWLGNEGAIPQEAAFARAHREIDTALRQNEALGEAHSVRAGMLLAKDDVVGTRREAQRAIQLNPSLAEPYRWLAQLAGGEGRPQEMVALLEAAQRLDPANVNIAAFLGHAYLYAGRHEEALAHWERSLLIASFRTHLYRAEYFLGRGDLVEARTAVEEVERLRPQNIWSVMIRGVFDARSGRADDARRAVEELERRAGAGAPTDFLLGFVRLALGETDAYFVAMERALARHDLPVLELLYSPLLASVRNDPRTLDLLKRQSALHPPPG
jgi:adenylate cyclase